MQESLPEEAAVVNLHLKWKKPQKALCYYTLAVARIQKSYSEAFSEELNHE